MEVNRTTKHLGAEGQLDDTQVLELGHPTEDTTRTTWAWPEWITGEQPGVVGTSSQPTQQED